VIPITISGIVFNANYVRLGIQSRDGLAVYYASVFTAITAALLARDVRLPHDQP
jgi:hypothetical protein